MNEYAGVATLAGESISYMAAMSATLIERGVSAQKAGTALRMVYARIAGNINGAADALNQWGIATEDANGNLRSLEEIFGDLEHTYAGMQQADRQALAQAVAGNRHYARFILLMEDIDRVQELNTIGLEQWAAVMTEAGDATGYLEGRLNENVVALEQAEAALRNVQGEIGERLLPATAAATQFQADFNEAFLDFVNVAGNLPAIGGWMEDLGGRMLYFRQVISDIYAPFFTAYISIRQLMLAVQVYRQISRAIAGERLAYISSEVTGIGALTNTTRVLALEQLNLRIAQSGGAENYLLLLNEERIRQQDKLALLQAQHAVMKLNEMIGRIDHENTKSQLNYKTRQLHIETLIENKRKQRVLLGWIEAEQERNLTLTHQQKSQSTKQLRDMKIQLNELLSQEFMLEQDIAVLGKEIVLGQKAKTDQLMTQIAEQAALVEALVVESGLVKELVVEFSLLADMIEQARTETQGMNYAISNTSTIMNQVSIASMIATSAVFLFGSALPFVSDGVEAARVAMVLMLITMVPLMASMGGFNIILGATAAELYLASIAAIAFNISAWMSSIALMYQTMGLGTTIGALLTYILAIGGATTATGFFTGAVAILTAAIVRLAIVSVIGVILIALAVLMVKVADHFGLFEDAVDSLTESLGINEDMFANWEDDISGFDMTGYISELDAASAAQQDFANAREEMFFGFKAGNVTGALVKQIQQQGVENFIANTEIIQTNNFNGLTTDQAAEQIMDAIESEAGLRGFNLSLVG